ncbi:hypothetical protein EV363DRAFT_459669 [Boletus edulis]|nr:hypothetical protein EV363DRAFT_459669 [Boletus edulis]
MQAILNLLKLMPSEDVLDTLTFNMLPPADNVHNAIHWSGMVMLDRPTEHPSYETDIHHPTNAHISATGNTSRACTVVDNAPLWKVMVTKPEDSHAASTDIQIRAWPSIADLSQYIKLTEDFSRVERSADYVDVVGRVERSLAANLTLLKPLLEKATGGAGNEVFSLLQNPPSTARGSSGLPPNRLGDESLFDQEVTVLVCRSKSNNLFHYGIVVTPNEDGTWHKVCTASFSASCVVATQIESTVVIGE